MGRKLGLVATALLIVLAMLAAHSFGFLGVDDFIYVGKLIAGWAAYVCVIAILYSGLERLIPSILCAPSQDPETPPPAA